LTEFYLQ